MSRRPGRNDPCWCGSGKKLKKCHGTPQSQQGSPQPMRVRPLRVPAPVTTHFVKKGGKLIEQPGTLAVRLIGHRPETVDSELRDLRSGWATSVQDALFGSSDVSGLGSRLDDIQHKLQGVRYHRQNYEGHEDEFIRQFETEHVPPAGAELVLQEPKLIFEIEAFLYQMKSCLDMLAHLLKNAGYRSIGESFGDHGERIIKQLPNAPEHCSVEAASLETLITVAQSSWLDEAISMRDTTAHQGMLQNLSCFVQRPYIGGQNAELHYPEMPNGQRARHYLERVERELRAFVSQFVELALQSRRKGPKA